jgi:hypothetical protein
MLDGLATRYKLLPSEVLSRGDTLDVLVMDRAQAWEQYQRDLYESKTQGRAPPPPKNIPKTELQALLDSVRKQ